MQYDDLGITMDDKVAVVEIQRPPNNFFDVSLIRNLAAAFREMDDGDDVRAIVLCSQGKHFCAGNDFSGTSQPSERFDGDPDAPNPLYAAATELFATKKPVIAAVQGAAVGGGFGLAVMPDFRVVCPEARFNRQLRQARIPSGVRSDSHPAPADWTPAGAPAVPDRQAHRRRGSAAHRSGRRADRSGVATRRGDQARHRNRRERPPGSAVGARDHASRSGRRREASDRSRERGADALGTDRRS